MRRLLDHDPLTGITEIFDYDRATDEFVIETVQNARDVVEDARARFNAIDERAGWRGEYHRVASIPLVVWQELEAQGIANDERALRKWLDDPDNRFFRTRPGRLSR